MHCLLTAIDLVGNVKILLQNLHLLFGSNKLNGGTFWIFIYIIMPQVVYVISLQTNLLSPNLKLNTKMQHNKSRLF